MPENETILVKKLHWNVKVFPGGKRWWDHLADQNSTSTKHDFTWTEETRVFFLTHLNLFSFIRFSRPVSTISARSKFILQKTVYIAFKPMPFLGKARSQFF